MSRPRRCSSPRPQQPRCEPRGPRGRKTPGRVCSDDCKCLRRTLHTVATDEFVSSAVPMPTRQQKANMPTIPQETGKTEVLRHRYPHLQSCSRQAFPCRACALQKHSKTLQKALHRRGHFEAPGFTRAGCTALQRSERSCSARIVRRAVSSMPRVKSATT